jgi:hypothetical protein
MDLSSMLLAAITTLAAFVLVVGHRSGWLVSTLTDFAPIRKSRGFNLFRRRESRWKRVRNYRPHVGRALRWRRPD